MEAPLLFPLPEIEPRIQQLLERTLAMNGLLVVTEARYGVSVESGAPPPNEPDPVESIRFVPFAKIEAFNSVLRRRPDGGDLAEQICSLLLDHYGSSAKPVLLLRRNGNHPRHRSFTHFQRMNIDAVLKSAMDRTFFGNLEELFPLFIG